MKSIYALSAIQYDLKQIDSSSGLSSQIIFGYFSNLKKAYSNLNGKNLPSYSTLARKIKLNKSVTIENVNLSLNKRKVLIKRVSISILEINQFYKMDKSIQIESLIIGEMYRNNLQSIVAQI